MEPVRKTQEATHFREVRAAEGQVLYEPCSPGEKQAIATTLTELAEAGKAAQVQTPKISMSDFRKVMLRARPTVSPNDLVVFENFTKEFGEDA